MIINPVKINDIPFKKFLITILVIQFGMAGFVAFQSAGLNLSFFSSIVGIIDLCFVPGIIIIRILRLHKLSTAETITYSVGLSIAFVMLIGLLINQLGTAIGISRPLAAIPLIVGFSIAVFLLCILAYIRDRHFSEPSFIHVKATLSSPVLFLLLLPLMAVLGAFLVRFYHSNIVLLLLMVLIASVPILIALNKFIPVKCYPLAVFTTSLALIYHMTMISGYLGTSDVMLENYFSELTLLNSHWDSSITHNYNAMLSDTILPAVYSRLLNIESTWVFKAVYPVIISIVPFTLYQAFAKQVDSRAAFLGTFLFMSAGFAVVGASITKSAIAWIFLAILILLFVSKEIIRSTRITLLLMIAPLIVVTHYGTSLMMIIAIIMVFPVMYVLYGRKKDGVIIHGMPGVLIVWIALAFLWYAYIGNSSIFSTVVDTGHYISLNLADILNPFSRETVALEAIGLEGVTSTGQQIAKILYYVIILFTFTGILKILKSILKHEQLNLAPEFIAFGLVSFAGWGISIVVPYFGWGVGGSLRFFTISLLFLAPICVLGGETCLRLLSRCLKVPFQNNLTYLRFMLSLVLIPFFLYSIGFANEITRDIPRSVPLSIERMEQSGEPTTKTYLNMEYTYESAVYSARWLSQRGETSLDVYADHTTINHVLPSYGMIFPSTMIPTEYKVTKNAYIYLNNMNVVDGLLYVLNPEVHTETSVSYMTVNTHEIFHYLDNKVYANNRSEIYSQN